MHAQRLRYTVALVAGCSVLAAAPSHGQATWFVDADAPGPADGLTWATAFTNPQDALGAASATDTIRVARGTFMPDGGWIGDGGCVAGSGDREATFALISGVTVEGGYAGFSEVDSDATRPRYGLGSPQLSSPTVSASERGPALQDTGRFSC